MIELSKEEYKFCETHLETIVQIVKTASCSMITPEFRNGLFEIGKKYNIMSCGTCNNSIYNGCCRIYNIYLENKTYLDNKTKKKIKKEKEVEDGNKNKA